MKILLRFCLCLFLALLPLLTQAQQLLSGTILDATNGAPLAGANILLAPSAGTVTDAAGRFSIPIPAGRQQIHITFVGYVGRSLPLQLGADSSIQVALQPLSAELRLVTVTGSKYERSPLREVSTVEVLKADLINNVNAVRLADAIDKVPGVTVVDGQVSIRNGSGFSYGAGSRTLMVVDGQPLLTSDRNDIRWNFIPVEMIDQVEVVKGATSALYGSGALNGTIQVRTFWPGAKKSETRVQTFYTHFGQPRRPELAWWGTEAPNESGIGLAHGQRIGRLDLVGGYNHISTNSFIQNGDQQQDRFTLKARWRPKRDHGLTAILTASLMNSAEADYGIWNDADSGAYIPLRGNQPGRYDGLVRIDRRQWQVSPSLSYRTRQGAEHLLQSRWYQLAFLNFSQNLQTNLYSVDYNYRKNLNKNIQLTAGAHGQWFDVLDPLNFGDRSGQTRAVFAQLNWMTGRLNTELGLRYEQFDIAGLPQRAAPVLRLGTNYLLNKNTSLRASFGQGYRFPSFSEMFVNRPNERISIYPNPALQPEYGWTAELGIKREFNLAGSWSLLADFSFFMMDYRDMTDFQLGIFLPDSITNPTLEQSLQYAGFQSQNLDHARIGGFEFSVSSRGKIGRVPLRILAGYTYSYPVDLNADSSLQQFFTFWGRTLQSAFQKDDFVMLQPMLRYRNRHLIKLDVESGFDQWLVGIDFRYYSKIEKVDPLFTGLIPGVSDYLATRSGNEYIFNLRLAYDFKQFGQLSLILNNALNREYALRVARMDPPRNLSIQYRLRI